MGNSALSFINQIRQSGLLPMLLSKAGLGPQTPGQAPVPAAAPPPVTATPAQPGVGGAPPIAGPRPAGPGGPPVKYDPSGAGTAMPQLTPQPHEMVNSIMGLLMNWNQRKQKGIEAEAENVAARLTKAIQDGDKETIEMIKADPHQMKVMDKVFKGWRTKMEQASKPGDKPDPVVTGAERGIVKALTPQQPQARPPAGTPPGAMGGYRPPQPSQAEQFAAAQQSAAIQQAKADPDLLKKTQLTSGEVRATELGAGPQKVEAEIARYNAMVLKAGEDVQRAKYEADKAYLEVRNTQEKMTLSGKRDEALMKRLDLLNRTAQTHLDITRQQLEIAKQKRLGIQNIGQSYRLKYGMIGQAEQALQALVGSKAGIDKTNVVGIINLLKSAGAIGIAKSLQDQQSTWYKSYSNPQEVLDELREYKKAFDDTFKKETSAADTGGAGGEGDTSDTTDDATEMGEGEPMEGDIVEGKDGLFYFKGGDPGKQENYRPATPAEIEKDKAKNP